LDSALAGNKVGPTHGHSSRGIESLAPLRANHAGYDRPPGARTSHVASQTKSGRHLSGNPHNPMSWQDGKETSAVMGLDRDRPTADSPVPPRDRQLPDKNIVTKAQEVASEINKHGEGEGFPHGGTMAER
jgi:hypothetical protein